MQHRQVPGWFGKLPALGDFASRRLDVALLEAWDDWLAGELAAWREADPGGWLARYLEAGSQRFLAMPGALAADRGALCGVLMPSVDRVGRYFPLTLCYGLQRAPALDGEWHALLDWLRQLEELAVGALRDDWSVAQLEAELERVAQHAPAWCDGADGRGAAAYGDAPAAGGPAATLAQAQPGWIWWLGADDELAASARRSRGLVRGGLRALFGGADEAASFLIDERPGRG